MMFMALFFFPLIFWFSTLSKWVFCQFLDIWRLVTERN